MTRAAIDTAVGLVTVLIVGLIAVAARGIWRRLPIIFGAIGGYLLYLLFANGFGLGKPIDLTKLAAAPWIGLPKFATPSFHADAMFLIAPVVIILVAENLGHIKAIGAMTGRSLDSFLGRAFLGDSLATIVSGFGGGTGVTTYAENIGVMAATKIYSTLLFAVAAIVSILLGFSPKFGALILSIPAPVIGGLSRLNSGTPSADMHQVGTAGTPLQNWPQFYRVIASCPPEKNLASCIATPGAVRVR